jgi:hypothetical protein
MNIFDASNNGTYKPEPNKVSEHGLTINAIEIPPPNAAGIAMGCSGMIRSKANMQTVARRTKATGKGRANLWRATMR